MGPSYRLGLVNMPFSASKEIQQEKAQMSEPHVIIACVGLGWWYPVGVRRLLHEFEHVSPGYRTMTWIDELPPGAPSGMVKDGWDYTGYSSKPFALKAAMDAGADIGILLDASFWPIRDIKPLVDHIDRTGYYFCDNWFRVGEWCNDAILEYYGVTRDEALTWPDLSSYCVGLDFRQERCRTALGLWCADSTAGLFVGPHTNIGHEGRNIGWCSDDPRCKGHRFDQSSLNLIARRLQMTNLTPRPYLTAYAGDETEDTVLICRGMGSE